MTITITKPYEPDGDIGEVDLDLYNSNNECIWSHNTWRAVDDAKMYYQYKIGLNPGTYLLNIT